MVTPVNFAHTVNRAALSRQPQAMPHHQPASVQTGFAAPKADLFFKGESQPPQILKAEEANTLMGVITGLNSEARKLKAKIARARLTGEARIELKDRLVKLRASIPEASLLPEKHTLFVRDAKKLSDEVDDANFTEEKTARLRGEYQTRKQLTKGTTDYKVRGRFNNQPAIVAANREFIDALTASRADLSSTDDEQESVTPPKKGVVGKNILSADKLATQLTTVARLKSQVRALKIQFNEAHLTTEKKKEFVRRIKKLEDKIATASVKVDRHQAFETEVIKLGAEIAAADVTPKTIDALQNRQKELELALRPYQKRALKDEEVQIKQDLKEELQKISQELVEAYIARKPQRPTYRIED